MIEMFKDAEIGGSKYQIGRMTARNGSWITMQILSKILPQAISGQMSQIEGLGALPANRSEMSEAEFQNIQEHCLAVCRRYETIGTAETPLPIMARPGVFAMPELEYDLITIFALTAQTLIYNIAPFFEGDGLMSVLGNLPGLKLSNLST